MVNMDWYSVALTLALGGTFYFYVKCQYYRMKSLRKKALKQTNRERSELEKKRFMRESERKWGVIK